MTRKRQTPSWKLSMPPSDAELSQQDQPVPGQNLAVAAEALFLANLLLIPVVGFLALLWVYRRHIDVAPPLARCHLRQTVAGSLWGGLLLVGFIAAFLVLVRLHPADTWMVVILYFTCVHSTFILLGALGLARAMAGKPYVYPVVGPPCPDAGHAR